jgi:hypothetical protein
MSDLYPIKEFKSEAEFIRVRRLIDDLVTTGRLKSEGLEPSAGSFFVERFLSDAGETWLLAVPDQAFRGYLRKA